MLTLTEGMLLYHGSFTQVSQIDLNKCKHGKDFGRGFYLTSSYKQAQAFVPLSVKKQIKEGFLSEDTTCGYITVFHFHPGPDTAVHLFQSADEDWLHYVASNRRDALFPEIRKRYERFDIVGGKIANDRTALTLQLYTSGGYGDPGSAQANSIAITTLLPNRLEDQFCFRSKKSLQTLEFIRSDRYDFKSIRT